MKEFRILQNCSVCGQVFDSDYRLAKHMSADHPSPEKAGWIGEDDSCGCGSEHSHPGGHC